MRRCKNCGRCFPRDRGMVSDGVLRVGLVRRARQRCRDVGAHQCSGRCGRRDDDAIQGLTAEEYKRRFAWIKAGRITDQQFYDWSERARAEKDKCEQGLISTEGTGGLAEGIQMKNRVLTLRSAHGSLCL